MVADWFVQSGLIDDVELIIFEFLNFLVTKLLLENKLGASHIGFI